MRSPPTTTHANRELAREVAQWLTIWLQNPQIFGEWLSLRRSTADFQVRFCRLNSGTFPPSGRIPMTTGLNWRMNLKSDLSDSELLRSMLAGDEEALALLYRRRQAGSTGLPCK